MPKKPPRPKRDSGRDSGRQKRKEKPGFPPPTPSKPPRVRPDGVGMRLNKYVAHSGVCSRRQAGDYVKQGLVMVNGEVQPDPSYQVKEGDVVKFRDKAIQPEERKVYLLLNKPKDIISTVSDDRGRRTVIDLLQGRVKERVFPVGRLDRNTTGLILLTNDGDLAKKLTHPSHMVKKAYQIVLDRPMQAEDLEKIRVGITLEEGTAKVDGVDYVDKRPKNEIGMVLHIGWNRIVRRLCESVGYKVERLDRVYFAGLTKKDLPRGFWRRLTEKEIIMLRHFS